MTPLRTAAGLILLATALAPATRTAAQSATPLPKLNPMHLIGTYYVIARLPSKQQKSCLGSELVLYALGDKKDSVNIVTTCQVKLGNSDFWNDRGKFSPSGGGSVRLHWIWPFTRPYWIVGFAPDATWAIAGTPNHKSLWLLSGTPTLPAATLAQLKSSAAAQGYDITRLVTIPQSPLLPNLDNPPAQPAAPLTPASPKP